MAGTALAQTCVSLKTAVQSVLRLATSISFKLLPRQSSAKRDIGQIESEIHLEFYHFKSWRPKMTCCHLDFIENLPV